MKSRIETYMVRMICFSRKHFGKRLLIAYYIFTLMYVSLYGDWGVERKYGEVDNVNEREKLSKFRSEHKR